MRTICGAFGSEALIEEAFKVAEYDPAKSLSVGQLSISFQHVPHFIDAWAVRIAEGDSTFVFGADCGPSDELREFATGADLLMLEATFAHDAEEADGHMTPAQAAALARDANAARLVLTHISDCLDLEASQRAATEVYGNSVAVAAAGDSWQI
jgi:ribonuclease BN (tRNA processing enzyme)